MTLVESLTLALTLVLGIVTTAALIVGPRSAARLAMEMQKEDARRRERYDLLAAIVGTRFDNFSMDRFRALAMIELVFADDEIILKLWREWHEAVSSGALETDQELARRARRYADLIVAIARATGYTQLTRNEMERSYYPEVLRKLNNVRVESEVHWNRVLRSSKSLAEGQDEAPSVESPNVIVRSPPTPE